MKAVVAYRLSQVDEALDLARMAVQKGYWNSAMSRLYYTCFYLITALFAKHHIQAHTHTGVKTVFSLQFIREGKIESKWGKLLAMLLDKRQIGDYGDFPSFSNEQVMPLLEEVGEFRLVMLQMLKD